MQTKKNENWDGYFSRSYEIGERASTLNEEKRTVEAIIATENPVTVMDWSRWETIDEILLTDGMSLAKARQVPLLDNHSRYETADIVGSARQIKRQESGDVVATLNFSSLERANDIWTLAKEGHLTDVSIGYKTYPDESVFLNPGEETVIKGRSFKNTGSRTLAVRKKWELKEVSTTPIGADATAKFRAAIMPVDIQDNVQPQNRNENPKGETVMEKPVQIEQTTTQPEARATQSQAEIEAATNRKAHELAEQSIRTRENISQRGELMGFTAEEVRALVKDVDFLKNDAEARSMEILFAETKKRREKDRVPPQERTTVNTDENDNFRKAATDALCLYGNLGIDKKDEENLRKSQFVSLMGPLTVMRAWLSLKGVRAAAWLSPQQVIEKCAQIRATAAQGSGDFANVFLDVANKSLARGWEEAPTTYQIWTGTDSIPNFMTKNIVKISLAGDAKKILEGEGFPFTARSDSKETASLETAGVAYGLSRQAIINDELAALTDTPRQLNGSIRRYINRKVYTDFYGTNMAGMAMGEDNTAMFTSGHGNLVASGSGAVPSTTTLATARRKMMKMALPSPDGSNSEAQYTNIAPKFILAHMDLDKTIEQLVGAQYDPTSAGDLKPNLAFIRRLVPIFDPILDEIMDAFNSNAGHHGWYLIADPRELGCVTVYNLTGQSAPTMRSRVSDVGEPLGTMWDIYYDYGIGPVDYRGAQANFGQ